MADLRHDLLVLSTQRQHELDNEMSNSYEAMVERVKKYARRTGMCQYESDYMDHAQACELKRHFKAEGIRAEVHKGQIDPREGSGRLESKLHLDWRI